MPRPTSRWAPPLALILGLVAGNTLRLPAWLDTSLRTEYSINTGIVLLGATLLSSVFFRDFWLTVR